MRFTATILCIMLFFGIVVVLSARDKDVDIYSTRLGDKILELAETRQLTTKTDGKITHIWMSPDGKHVAYIDAIQMEPECSFINGMKRLCIVSATGGRPATLLDEWPYLPLFQLTYQEADALLKPGDEFSLLFPPFDEHAKPSVAWSPDGRLFAFAVLQRVITLLEPDDVDGLSTIWVIVVDASGTQRVSFPIVSSPEVDSHVQMLKELKLHWSNDSRRLAMTCYSSNRYGILVLDVATGTMHRVFPKDHPILDCAGWSVVGGDLLYVAVDKRSKELRQTSIDGSRDVRIGDWHEEDEVVSPDGRFKFMWSGQQEVQDLSTGDRIPIPGRFRNWSPDGRFFSFCRSVSASPDDSNRVEFNSLWVHPLNDSRSRPICVAADIDRSADPAWSGDSMRLAYVHRGRLHTAELLLREASSTSEKMELGLPLSESEEQEVLLNNAKQIGIAMMMYNNDWDGQWPSSDTYAQSIDSYLRNNNILNRPGTDEMIFQFYPPPAGDYNPSETVMGVFDVGRGWRVVLYADGHVRRERN